MGTRRTSRASLQGAEDRHRVSCRTMDSCKSSDRSRLVAGGDSLCLPDQNCPGTSPAFAFLSSSFLEKKSSDELGSMPSSCTAAMISAAFDVNATGVGEFLIRYLTTFCGVKKGSRRLTSARASGERRQEAGRTSVSSRTCPPSITRVGRVPLGASLRKSGLKFSPSSRLVVLTSTAWSGKATGGRHTPGVSSSAEWASCRGGHVELD